MDALNFVPAYILPFLIFAVRVVDVSLGTMRIIALAKGHKVIAPVLALNANKHRSRYHSLLFLRSKKEK